jgi:hypothetical protein
MIQSRNDLAARSGTTGSASRSQLSRQGTDIVTLDGVGAGEGNRPRMQLGKLDVSQGDQEDGCKTGPSSAFVRQRLTPRLQNHGRITMSPFSKKAGLFQTGL